MYQSGGTIYKLLARVGEGDYLLPSIQREFVWEPAQICQLFDSLMQEYPFGTFLFWKILPENLTKYQFYGFIQHYHQRDANLCPRLESLPSRAFTAVLDGQQRITALNIGLRGSYAGKVRNKWWTNDDAFPRRTLHLNLLGQPDPDTGCQYQFEFLTEEEAGARAPGILWFKVPRVFNAETNALEDLTDSMDELAPDVEERRLARRTLRSLHRVIHDHPVVTYYEEEEQSLEKVLNIFIRLNSGGTPLSYSDLLLSIAVAQWKNLDAREEIRSLVKEMNAIGAGFQFSKDLVLKAGLMLSGIGSVGFKVENFSKANMHILEANWQRTRDALILAVKLVSSFGFNGQNLPADSPLLPIAFYLHNRKLGATYLTRSEHAQDRHAIRLWLLKSLLKASGIWGSGLDTLLTGLRGVLIEHGTNGFPVTEIERHMAGRGKTLEFTLEETRELSESAYGERLTFPLLSILFPGHDFSRTFHVDHIFPKGRFRKAELKRQGVDDRLLDEYLKMANGLANLQLLDGSVNNEKRQQMPHTWYASQWPDPEARAKVLQNLAVTDLPESLQGFPQFYERRKQTLEARIRAVLLPGGLTHPVAPTTSGA